MDQIAMLSGLRGFRGLTKPLTLAPEGLGTLTDDDVLMGLHELAREARKRGLMQTRPVVHLIIGGALGLAVGLWLARK